MSLAVSVVSVHSISVKLVFDNLIKDLSSEGMAAKLSSTKRSTFSLRNLLYYSLDALNAYFFNILVTEQSCSGRTTSGSHYRNGHFRNFSVMRNQLKDDQSLRGLPLIRSFYFVR